MKYILILITCLLSTGCKNHSHNRFDTNFLFHRHNPQQDIEPSTEVAQENSDTEGHEIHIENPREGEIDMLVPESDKDTNDSSWWWG